MNRTIRGTALAVLVGGLSVAIAATAAPAVSQAASSSSQPPRPDPSVLFIGASYTAGWGASRPDLGYAHDLAKTLDWPATYSAEPGAGYINGGNDGVGSFRAQINKLPATLHPSLVVIQGGRNDAGVPAGPESAAVAGTLRLIRQRFGDPTIVMLGDVPASRSVSAGTLTTNRILDRAAREDGALFIDPIAEHWMTARNLPGFRSDVPGHPDDAGHRYIAHRLLEYLVRHGLIRRGRGEQQWSFSQPGRTAR